MPDNHRRSWTDWIADAVRATAELIKSVETILGLSALCIIALLFILWITPAEAAWGAYLMRLGFLLAIYLTAIIAIHYAENTELTFRVRVARREAGGEVPSSGMIVHLLKNGEKVQAAESDEDGDLFFKVRVGPKDELSVVVMDPVTRQPKSNPAALYRQGQCAVAKKILVAP